MTAHIPVPKSTAEIGNRDGGADGSPLIVIIPLTACTSGSKAGSLRIGPRAPKPEISQ